MMLVSGEGPTAASSRGGKQPVRGENMSLHAQESLLKPLISMWEPHLHDLF